MMKRLFWVLLIVLLFGCNPASQPETTAEPTEEVIATCLGFRLEDAIDCTEADENNVVVQSTSDEDVSLRSTELTITFDGELQLSRTDAWLAVTVLSGHSSIESPDQSYALETGQVVSLSITETTFQQVESTAETTTAEIGEDSTEQPEETAEAATEEATATASATVRPGFNPTPDVRADCTPRSSWNNTYVVVAGDVLSLIARDYNMSVAEMAEANCLRNPGILRIGQVLRVPYALPTDTPGPTAEP